MGFLNFNKKKIENHQVMTLHCSENDLNSNKAILLGLYRNLKFDVVWKDSDQMQDQFSNALNINESDKVPCIYDGDFSTSGVSSVLTYFNIKGGAPSLLPKKARLLAEQYYWIQLLTDKLEPMLINNNCCGKDVQNLLKNINVNLSSRSFLVGEFSLADIHWYVACNELLKQGVFKHSDYQSIDVWMDAVATKIPDSDLKYRLLAA